MIKKLIAVWTDFECENKDSLAGILYEHTNNYEYIFFDISTDAYVLNDSKETYNSSDLIDKSLLHLNWWCIGR